MQDETFRYEIDMPRENAAGVAPYTDHIVVTMTGGLRRSTAQAFDAFLCGALAQWHDGATVRSVSMAERVEATLPPVDGTRLLKLLQATHGKQAMLHADLIAMGCWLHWQGQRTAGVKAISEVFATLPQPGNRDYFATILDKLAGHEAWLVRVVEAHSEINELFGL
ncbi:MAG TPA: hypothetical protein VGD21_16640 [Lysobacter sp.]